MSAVTTVALLSRKQGMSAALFSKYWRDVHGLLAARIPGFDAYVQYHLQGSLAGPEGELQGIAVVDFAGESERAGLADSEVAALIRQDEVNLFGSSVLYNLACGADRDWQGNAAPQQDGKHYFLLLQRAGTPGQKLVETLEQQLIPALLGHAHISRLRLFDLNSGDAGHWQTAGVDNRLSDSNSWDVMLQITGTNDDLPADIQRALAGLAQPPERRQLYPAMAAYPMVMDGRPTHLGLRGLDVLQTIEAAGAANQREPLLLQRLYGLAPSDCPAI